RFASLHDLCVADSRLPGPPSSAAGHSVRAGRSAPFSLVPRRPPASSLFPYTTLFRSPLPECAKRDLVVIRRINGLTCPAVNGGRDRKSTRLNSSHEWISYAVFCLKKKKRLLVVREPLLEHDGDDPQLLIHEHIVQASA